MHQGEKDKVVYQACRVKTDSQDFLDFQEAKEEIALVRVYPDRMDDLDEMETQDLKVPLVLLEDLEKMVLPEQMVNQENQVGMDFRVRKEPTESTEETDS